MNISILICMIYFLKNMNNIIVTGGSGRFGQILKNFGYKFKFPKKMS